MNCSCIKKNDNPIDPFEKQNRRNFEINQKIDTMFYKPAARMVTTIVPKPVQGCTLNFFNNLLEIRSIINFNLQGRPKRALNAGQRFIINSTLGIAGLVEVANHMGYKRDPTDFGITLAVWGDKRSPYLYSALFGPSTLRDSVGSLYDAVLFPPYYYFVSWPVYIGASGYYFIALRAELLKSESLIDAIALDPYIMIRNAYLQRRQYLITGEKEMDDKDEDEQDIVVDDEEPDDCSQDNQNSNADAFKFTNDNYLPFRE